MVYVLFEAMKIAISVCAMCISVIFPVKEFRKLGI